MGLHVHANMVHMKHVLITNKIYLLKEEYLFNKIQYQGSPIPYIAALLQFPTHQKSLKEDIAKITNI